MSPALLGLAAALCWGVADFAARFTGRAMGSVLALLSVTFAGWAGLSALLLVSGRPLPTPGGLTVWDWLGGLATTVALLMFYEALRRGPVVVAAPLVGTYPAWALALAVAFFGGHPTSLQWAASLGVIAGAFLAARRPAPGHPAARAGNATIALALGCAPIFAVAVIAAQQASLHHGALTTVWYVRAIGTALLAALVLARRPRHPPARWVPVILGQAGLDTGGYVFLYAAAAGVDGSIATVTSSAFGVVTILLARAVLKETLSPSQWLGAALVFAGAATLTAAG